MPQKAGIIFNPMAQEDSASREALENRLKQIDESVHEVAEAIQSAVRWGMAHREDPAALKKSIDDCRDLLNQVLDAEVLNW